MESGEVSECTKCDDLRARLVEAERRLAETKAQVWPPCGYCGRSESEHNEFSSRCAGYEPPGGVEAWSRLYGRERERSGRLEREASEMRAVLRDSEPWVWLGDGTDDLESMSDDMVVRITAGLLRGMIRNQTGREVERLRGLLERWREYSGGIACDESLDNETDAALADAPGEEKTRDDD